MIGLWKASKFVDCSMIVLLSLSSINLTFNVPKNVIVGFLKFFFLEVFHFFTL